MSSRSESPSITNFFKVQRKRPRTGKDEAVSGSKKLLLESPASVIMAVSPIPAAVAKVKEGSMMKEKEGGGGKEVVRESGRKVVKKSVKKVVKEVVKEPAKEVVKEPAKEVVKEPVKEVVKEPVKKVVKEPAKEVVKEPTKEAEKEVAKDAGKEVPTSKPTEGSVQFLKLGALSPAKKKKLTTEQVARLLKKKNKLSDLKNALEGINQCAQKLNDFRRTVADANAKMSPVQKALDGGAVPGEQLNSSAKKSMQGISPSQFYSPSADRALKSDLDRVSATKVPASPSKLVNMNNKVKKRLFEEQSGPSEGDKKVPAYQRFHNLAQKTALEKGAVTVDEADLPLPYHFKVLKELFIGVETVVGIMKGRKETIIFPKVKAGVLELVRTIGLREKHLAQMVTVLPGCYTFGLEKVGLHTHIKIDVEDMIPSVVCARRKAFHAALIKICLEHHKNFLLGLVPPIVVPVDKQITRWHPNFKIDQIPDIAAKDDVLPVKPTPDKISSARDVIAKAQNILEHGNPRMKQAMKNMLNNSEGSGEQKVQGSVVEPKPKPAATLKSMKGISQSLLEKIRNREREKLLNEMTRSPAASKKLQMMRKLPTFVKIIRNMIVAEKKVALPLDVVTSRVSHSIQNLSGGDSDAHIRLLVTLLPHWIKIIKVSHSDQEYLRIDKAVDINNLLQEMDDIIKKHSS